MDEKIKLKKLCIFFIFIFFLSTFIKAEEYRIQPGDILQITVLGNEDLHRELRVSAQGKISYPLIGEVLIKDQTITDVEYTLTNLLAKYLVSPQISVFIIQFSRVYVFGEVENPGAFELSKELTLLEAITMAGGLSQQANPKKIKVIRKKENEKKVIQIDLNTITQEGIIENDIPLVSGDMIIVPRSIL